MHDEYKRRRHLIIDKLKAIGLPCAEPEGAFYTFPSIEQTGLTSVDFAGKLLEEEGVAVVPGSAFGESGEGHVRCCYAVSISEIEEALDRMKRFVNNHTRNGR
jgi:aminotransferase